MTRTRYGVEKNADSNRWVGPHTLGWLADDAHGPVSPDKQMQYEQDVAHARSRSHPTVGRYKADTARDDIANGFG